MKFGIRGLIFAGPLRCKLAPWRGIQGLYRFFTLASLVLGIAGTMTAAHAQTYTDLHDFNPGAGDPWNFDSGVLAQGRDGNLYTESHSGGAFGLGTVFKITPVGNPTVIRSLSSASGHSPFGGLTLGLDGNLYGNGFQGGSANLGTAFKITPSGTLTVLHNFTNSGDGLNPVNAPVLGRDGNFYATTDANPETIYRVSTSGTFKMLHTLSTSQGWQGGQLTQGSDGTFYGAMNLGGANGYGTAFKMTPSGVFTVLHNFHNTDGALAAGGVVQAGNGKFYGAASLGGNSNAGAIYQLTSSGAFMVLHHVNGTTDGYEPFGQLILATDGNLYGVTNSGGSSNCGTIFKITTSGQFTVLHNFDGTHGCNPREQLTQRTDGLLYGDTVGGGAHGNGVFYSLNVGLHPFISLMTTSGKAGQVVQILGNGLTGTTGVKFGLGSASFTVVSNTYMTAVVPAAGTTGAVTVTTPSGIRVSSKNFRVLPVISSFSPTSGPAGSQVAITGTGLTQTTKVTFGGVAATNFTKSATQVTATVPTGAVTGKVAITTPGGTATSSGTFTVSASTQPGHCVYVCGSTRCGELTGYCVGSVGGACRQAYDPIHCPVGQPFKRAGTECGVGVDLDRSCTP